LYTSKIQTGQQVASVITDLLHWMGASQIVLRRTGPRLWWSEAGRCGTPGRDCRDRGCRRV